MYVRIFHLLKSFVCVPSSYILFLNIEDRLLVELVLWENWWSFFFFLRWPWLSANGKSRRARHTLLVEHNGFHHSEKNLDICGYFFNHEQKKGQLLNWSCSSHFQIEPFILIKTSRGWQTSRHSSLFFKVEECWDNFSRDILSRDIFVISFLQIVSSILPP